MLESNNVPTALQNISWQLLVKTKHTEDCVGHHEDQIKEVAEALKNLKKECPALLEEIKAGKSVIFNPGAVHRAEVENIGASAFQCAEELNENPHILDPIEKENLELVQEFLNAATVQAERICREFDKIKTAQQVREESIANIRRYAVETVADMSRMKLYLQQALQAVYEAQAAAEKAKDEFKKASAEAKNAKLEAKNAKSEAQIAKKQAEDVKIQAESVKDQVEAVKNQAESVKDQVEAVKNQAENVKKQAEGLLPNMLTILGILVAIIFAVVACYLTILLDQHGIKGLSEPYPKPFEFAKFLLMGQISLGIIFLLLYLVSKFTPYSLTCFCKRYAVDFSKLKSTSDKNTDDTVWQNCDCAKCKYQCSSPMRLRLRYPYVYGINLAFAFGYAVLLLWQVVNVYFRSTLDELIAKFPVLAIVGFAMIALVPIVVLCIVFRRGKEPNENAE